MLGILTVDPSSPNLWNLFMANLHLPWHPEDLELNGMYISQLAHADDLATASSGASGLQKRLDATQSWANDNGAETQIPKCGHAIFGPRQNHKHVLTMGGVTIPQLIKVLWAYGSRQSQSVYQRSTMKLKKKAPTVGNVTFGLQCFIGTLSAWDAHTLYMACIDPYLISGCDIIFDVNTSQSSY